MAHEEYKGHRIELRVPEDEELDFGAVNPQAIPKSKPKKDDRPDLLIDDRPVEYGQLPDGKYFLQKYAYDWRDDLKDLARGYIDYQIKTEEIRSEGDEKLEGTEPKEEK